MWRLFLLPLLFAVAILVSVAILVFMMFGLFSVDAPSIRDQFKSMPLHERQAYLRRSAPVYHVHKARAPVQMHSIKNRKTGWYGTTTQLTWAIDESLRRSERFRYASRANPDIVVQDGYPSPDAPDASPRLIILHVSGAWTGLFPDRPEWNTRLSGHAMPVRDLVSRFSFLGLDDIPVVGFRAPLDAVALLNFGQEDDQLMLTTIFEDLCRHNPNSQIVISADCLGGLRFTNWIHHYGQNGPMKHRLAGAIVEGPLPTMNRIRHPSANPHVNRLIAGLFGLVLPNFANEDPSEKTCAVPALVAILEQDGLCGSQDIPAIRRRFKKLHALHVVPKNSVSIANRTITHGNVYRWPPFIQHVRQFLHSLTDKPKKVV